MGYSLVNAWLAYIEIGKDTAGPVPSCFSSFLSSPSVLGGSLQLCFLGGFSMFVFYRGSKGEQLLRSICPPCLPLRSTEMIACSVSLQRVKARSSAAVLTNMCKDWASVCLLIKSKIKAAAAALSRSSLSVSLMHRQSTVIRVYLSVVFSAHPGMSPVKQFHIFSSCAAQWGPWQETVCRQAFFIL